MNFCTVEFLLFSDKQKPNIDACNDMDESQTHSKWKKPDSKGFILHNFIYVDNLEKEKS
jgi:hypothetical protein